MSSEANMVTIEVSKCSVKGCDQIAHARGYCGKHYSRARRSGALGEFKVCAVEDCTNKVEARGYCSRHYQRFIKYGDPTHIPEKRPRIRKCTWEGCEYYARAHGLCLAHYQKARYSSEYEHLIPETHRAPRCLLDGCDEPQYARGLCRKHDFNAAGGRPLTAQLEAEVSLATTGGRIRALRLERGWSIRDLAKRVGVTYQSVSQTEQGNSHLPKTLKKYADALGVGVKVLLPPDDPPTRYYTRNKAAEMAKLIISLYDKDGALIEEREFTAHQIGLRAEIPNDLLFGTIFSDGYHLGVIRPKEPNE